LLASSFDLRKHFPKVGNLSRRQKPFTLALLERFDVQGGIGMIPAKTVLLTSVQEFAQNRQ
jgi:hypothetical protein